MDKPKYNQPRVITATPGPTDLDNPKAFLIWMKATKSQQALEARLLRRVATMLKHAT